MPFLKMYTKKIFKMSIKMIIAALFIKQKLVTVYLFNNNETGSATGISIQCTYVRNNEKKT